MDAIKLIPQLYYDLISRVIPGVIALVLLSLALGAPLGGLVTAPFAGAAALEGSPLFLSVAMIGAAYIIGQLLAPLSDLYQRRVVEQIVRPGYWLFPAALGPRSPYPPAMRRFVLRELGLDGEPPTEGRPYIVALFVWYDWLRVWKPEAGARVEKIRAEYRMFGGVAVGAVLALALHLARALVGAASPHALFLVAALVMLGFATWGLARMYRTFQWSVLNQYYVSREAHALPHGTAPLQPELVPSGS